MSATSVKQDLVNLPNALTLLRIIVIPLEMWLLWRGDPVSCAMAAYLFAGAAVTDFADGYIARKWNLVSMTGKFLDPLADKLIVMASLVMLAEMGRLPAWIAVIIIAREISITGLRALASAEGIIIVAGAGGKLKTAFQLVGLIGLIIHYEYVTDWWIVADSINYHEVGLYLLSVSVVMSLWSGWGYFRGFLKGIEERASQSHADAP